MMFLPPWEILEMLRGSLSTQATPPPVLSVLSLEMIL